MSSPSSNDPCLCADECDDSGNSADNAGEANSLRLRFRFDRRTGRGGSSMRPASESDSIGEAGPRGERGEMGPRGPGLTGDLGDSPLPLRSGGEGVSSPEEGGEGVPVMMWALVRRNTGGESLCGGEREIRLDIMPWGGGEGEIDSNERPLLVLRLGIMGGGEGVRDSRRCLKRATPKSGEGERSI